MTKKMVIRLMIFLSNDIDNLSNLVISIMCNRKLIISFNNSLKIKMIINFFMKHHILYSLVLYSTWSFYLLP